MPPVIAAAATALGVTGSITVVAATATAAAVTISYATLIGYAVTIGASIAYSSSQNAKMRNSLSALSDTGRNVMARDPLAAQRGIYGEVPVAGPIFFMHTTGAKNEILHVIMGIAGHECNAMNTIYFESPTGLETVPLDGAGNATGKYAGKFICKKHLGTNVQAAEALLVAAAPAFWTANHKLLGTAYVYLQFTYDTTLFPSGMPTVKVLTQGKLLMDPRVGIILKTGNCIAANTQIDVGDSTGITVGMRVQGSGIVEGTRVTAIDGSGTSVHVDTAPFLTTATMRVAFGTVAWSANSALCAADYLSDYKLGRGIPWHRQNRTRLSSEANTCEELVVLADATTEQRYNTNGTFTSEQDALPELLGAMAGRRVDTGGLWEIFAGAYHSPVVGADFTDDDLVGAFQMQPRQSMRESYSGVRGTYISPKNDWQPADFPRVKNDEYTRQDGGRRRWKDVAYPFTISDATAQRLAKADMERGRQQIVFQAVYKLKAFKVACCDTIRITSTSEGWVNKEFEVINWALRVIGQGAAMVLAVALTCRETSPDVWDWANGEETVVDLAPNSNLPNAGLVAAPTGLTLLTDASTSFLSGTNFVPRLKASWNTPNDIFVESNGRTFIEYKKSADASWISWNDVPGTQLFDYITDVQIGVQYDVRIYFRNEIGVRSHVTGVAAYNTVTNYTIANDSAAPNAPTNLVATIGTGKMVRLKWDLSGSLDVAQYGIFRNTVNDFATATLIGYDPGNSYNDSTVTIGTLYYYWVVAYDAVPNASAALGPQSATPAYVGTGTIDPTAPSNPTGLTSTGHGTYQGGNGVQFAYEKFSLAALPAGAATQQPLFRKTGDTQWIPFGDFENTGAATDVRAIGLAVNTSYDFAAVAYSAFSVPSSVISIGAIVTQTSAAPNSPTGVSWGVTAADRANIPPSYSGGAGGAKYFAGMLKWTASTSGDIDYYQIRCNNTVGGFRGVTNVGKAVQFPCYSPLDLDATSPDGMDVRAVNTAGVASAWVNSGSPVGSFTFSYGTQNMAEQDKASVNVTGGTVTGITDLALADGGTAASSASGARSSLGVTATGTDTTYNYRSNNLSDVANVVTARSNLGVSATGADGTYNVKSANLSDVTNAATARTNLGVRDASHVALLAGGAPTEDFTHNHGFGTQQYKVIVQCVDPALDVLTVHNYGAGGNDANNCVIRCQALAGNIAGGNKRFTIHYLP